MQLEATVKWKSLLHYILNFSIPEDVKIPIDQEIMKPRIFSKRIHKHKQQKRIPGSFTLVNCVSIWSCCASNVAFLFFRSVFRLKVTIGLKEVQLHIGQGHFVYKLSQTHSMAVQEQRKSSRCKINNLTLLTKNMCFITLRVVTFRRSG